MSISLHKGEKVSLSKEANNLGISLDNVAVGLGWDQKGSLGSSFDIDTWALAISGDGIKTKNLVYFSKLNGADNCIHHIGDNITGDGDGDDEVILIELSKLPKEYKYILVGATIYRGKNRNQSFKDINNTFIRIYEYNSGKEICRYSEEFETELGDSTSILFGAIHRKDKQLEFNSIGKGEDIDRIPDVLNIYNNFSLDNYLAWLKKLLYTCLRMKY